MNNLLLKRSWLFLTVALSACGNAGGAAPKPVPGATLKPGLWRFVDRVVEMSSAGMSDRYLERLRSKADGHIVERCIGPGEAQSLFSLTDRISGNAQFEGFELKDGLIKARVNRNDRGVIDAAEITGSYDAENVVLVSKNSATGSPNPLGNIEFTIRRTGKRIGDCPA